MKSLAVVSQKGGVGKTTLALNLSYALSRINLRVVLVDTDPQGAVGHSLTGATESPGLAGVLAGRADVGQALLETRVAEFSILPLGNVPPSEGHDFVARLADGRLLSDLATRFEASHDVVVFDTPSGFGGATLGALYASDHAITPLQAEPVALRTLPQLFSVIGALRERGARVTLSGIVLSMLQQRNSDSLAVAEEVWTRIPADLVLETTVPRDPHVLAASAAGVPLGLLSRLRPPPVALVFDQIAAELSRRLELAMEEDDGPIGLFA